MGPPVSIQKQRVERLPFSEMFDEDVKKTLEKHQIGLTVEEARNIETLLGRAPTLVEAVIWGIQGSEHSSYKSSRRFLKMFPTTGKHVILGPKEDSGIVALTDSPKGKRWGVVISHESHNHPSQIVPFEGAATGVGGTVRDVACMGARVIGCMDLLRLGDLQTDESKRIATEVIRGIAGYSNPLGIPNLGGDTVFDSGFNSNCLVNAIAIGIVREDQIIHSYVPKEAGDVGYDIILVGKPTDRSGFGGAAFASFSMNEENREKNTGAVQEPNPFLERHLLVSTYALFDWLAAEGHLGKVSFKDLGAGGIVCATVEQVSERGFGVEVDLDKVHVVGAYDHTPLPPEVIACAETQERFCWTCHPSLTSHILKHYNDVWDLRSIAEHAQASVIGKVTKDGIYRLRHHREIVCEAKSQDITLGLQYNRPTRSVVNEYPEPEIECVGNLIRVAINSNDKRKTNKRINEFTIAEVFQAMLAHPNHASKSPALLHYDKTVIGHGIVEAGEADAAVIAPLQDVSGYIQSENDPGWNIPEDQRFVGLAVAGDGNHRHGKVSAYLQGVNAAVEAMCNVAAVGGTPRALTDCLNYGNPEIPEHLGALEDGVRGIADAARGVAIDGEPVPVISGNVSLYNSLPDGSAIPPSAIVACIGVLPDARKAVTMQLKEPGSRLLLIGERKDECGASAYYEILEVLGYLLPKPKFDDVARQISLVTAAVSDELLLSCHDISDGGLLLALFEMMLPQRKIGGNLGVDIDLDRLTSDLRSDTLLFTESHGFLLEVLPSKLSEVQKLSDTLQCPLWDIGTVAQESRLAVVRGAEHLLDERFSALRELWERGLRDALR